MYTIKVDLPELPNVLEGIINQVMPSISQAVEQTATEAQTAWQSGIWKAGGVWLENKRRAVNSIQMQMVTPLQAMIWSDDPVTQNIEEGFPERDLKAMLSTSDKVRESKKGKRYLYIPFRHNIPGNNANGNAMPSDIYQQAKELKPSFVTGMGSRISASGARVKQAQYSWGGRLEEGLAPKKQPYHTTDIYAGMVKMNVSTGGSNYMTFRTMVEGSTKWLVPASPGHYVLKSLSEVIGPRLEKNLEDAITQALS